ncbi:SH3 domain-containing protein [Roseibium sp.]|uniref:SH3 domain-containing protein n=1 Tax=Roseibium sp. TaxID=1936156 RepID=UPI003A9800A4
MTIYSIFIALSLSFPSATKADLNFDIDRTDDGLTFAIVSGTFEFDDDLTTFVQLVDQHRPTIIGFASSGGNISKAMEFGRLIRRFRLDTLQVRSLECASACSLAFMGGVNRFAEPGSIGVHRSSFATDIRVNTRTAVSAVQELTADILGYMSEMGVDPKLMQLALKTDANDIRYLSGREMAEFNLTTGRKAERAASERVQDLTTAQPFAPPIPAANANRIPVARTGTVRHPKGGVMMKGTPASHGFNVVQLSNGTPVEILADSDRWYRVRATGFTGYMHHTWVRVDQFEATPGLQRLIQIKSFDNLDDALTYAKATNIPASVFLATNGWFAVTVAAWFDKSDALKAAKRLKKQERIPEDSFVTLGNTYVVKLCCNEQRTTPIVSPSVKPTQSFSLANE